MRLLHLVGLVLLVTACAPERTAEERAAAEAELTRLASLAAQESLTEEDLQVIQRLLAGDHDAEHELGELELMVRYGEHEHAGHTISFLAAYLDTGEGVLCPAHELAHYYVFMRHGNERDAEHALEHAQEQLDAWIPRAREHAERYPTVQSIDELAAIIEVHLEKIEAGDTTATDDEISFLANEASVCVS